MARFREAPPEPAPGRLAAFCLAEWCWPGPVPAEQAIGRWHRARLAWHEEHAVTAPDRCRESVLGTFVDLMRAKHATRLYWLQDEPVRNPAAPLICTTAHCDGRDRCARRAPGYPDH
jgi:hypothetical protein